MVLRSAVVDLARPKAFAEKLGHSSEVANNKGYVADTLHQEVNEARKVLPAPSFAVTLAARW